MHAEVARRSLGYAWGRDHCPAVNAGPEKEVGHAPPGELRSRPGELLHVDFGVTRAEYTSDLQRVGTSSTRARRPRRRTSAWRGTRSGRRWTRGCRARPGVAGWEVDAAARSVSSKRDTRSRCTRSAISSGARRTTAGRRSLRGGIATERRRSASSRRATCSRSSTDGGPRPRVHRARGGRARHRRRGRVAVDSAARHLARDKS